MEIVVYKGLPEFEEWATKNVEFMKKFEITKEEVKKKLSMLLLCEMYSGNVEGRLTYKSISKSLDVFN